MLLSNNISEQLRALRRERGWSQEDLARELGVSFASISRWENGKAKPSKMASASIKRLLLRKVK